MLFVQQRGKEESESTRLCDSSSFTTTGLVICKSEAHARANVELRSEDPSDGLRFVHARRVQQREDELLGFQLAEDALFLHAVAQNRFDFVERGQTCDQRAKLGSIRWRIGAKHALVARADGFGERTSRIRGEESGRIGVACVACVAARR